MIDKMMISRDFWVSIFKIILLFNRNDIFLRILFKNKLLCYEYFSSEQNERNIEREREKERREIERREEEKREKERREEARKENERREKRNNNNRQNDLARLLGKLQHFIVQLK